MIILTRSAAFGAVALPSHTSQIILLQPFNLQHMTQYTWQDIRELILQNIVRIPRSILYFYTTLLLRRMFDVGSTQSFFVLPSDIVHCPTLLGVIPSDSDNVSLFHFPAKYLALYYLSVLLFLYFLIQVIICDLPPQNCTACGCAVLRVYSDPWMTLT